jgi:hypothetical protein
MIVAVAGCSSNTDPFPTLIPTAVIPSTPTLIESTETAIPTIAPTGTPDLPATRALPTVRIASLTPIRPQATTIAQPTPVISLTRVAPTLPPVRATVANGAASITITTAQLNQALKGAWRPGMAMDIAPFVTLNSGLINVEMRIQMKLVSLQLALTTVSTTRGTVLDMRAVSVSNSSGLTTTQIKQGHALVQTMLEWLVYQAGAQQGLQNLTYSGVSVGTDRITITFLTD